MIYGYFKCPLQTMNPIKLISPEQMSAHQRAFEITSILAAAIMRTHNSGQTATAEKQGQIPLGFSANQSVHTNPYQKRSSR